MKKHILLFSFLFSACLLLKGQSADPVVSRCIMSAGKDGTYLKDFRIQLGMGDPGDDFRYKANIYLWKNTKYRFTMCNSTGSKGDLVMTISDDSNNTVLTSFDERSGNTLPYVEFTSVKSGIYKLNFDFLNRQPGSGIGVVSMIN